LSAFANLFFLIAKGPVEAIVTVFPSFTPVCIASVMAFKNAHSSDFKEVHLQIFDRGLSSENLKNTDSPPGLLQLKLMKLTTLRKAIQKQAEQVRQMVESLAD
jgi:hypothetical protein